MNNLPSFVAFTAAIFGAIAALLMLLSHLEPTSRRHRRHRSSLQTRRGRGLTEATLSAQPAIRFGHELIAPGMLEHWVRVGWERSHGSLFVCDPSQPGDRAH